eukprot:jgi/Astpho2/5741/e_gw1.00080.200.1_t
MTEIVPDLFLAGICEVMHEVESKKNGITHILNVASEITNDRSADGYEYRHSGVSDDDPKNNIIPILDDNIAWVHEALLQGGRVMVHCWSGVSRAAITVMAYLVRYHKESATNAFHKVLAKRRIVDPWPRYLEQYQQWAAQQQETT